MSTWARTRTVADAMVRTPRTWGPSTTVAQARAAFANDHLHALLVTDGGRLLAVVDRADLVGAATGVPAAAVGDLAGRVVGADADLDHVQSVMAVNGWRRIAVVDTDGVLVGLLCRKRRGNGFCSDADVAARAAERAAIHSG